MKTETKTETKHTPGPWRLRSDAQGPCMVMHPELKGVAIANLGICFLPSEGYHEPETRPEPCPEINGSTHQAVRVANARLIAAAPELLEALKECDEILHYLGSISERFSIGTKARIIDASVSAGLAIAKATGGGE